MICIWLIIFFKYFCDRLLNVPVCFILILICFSSGKHPPPLQIRGLVWRSWAVASSRYMWRYVASCDVEIDGPRPHYIVELSGLMWRTVENCGLSSLMWRYVTSCGDLWPHVEICDLMWRSVASLASCGDMWPHVEICGLSSLVWRYVASCGDLWPL